MASTIARALLLLGCTGDARCTLLLIGCMCFFNACIAPLLDFYSVTSAQQLRPLLFLHLHARCMSGASVDCKAAEAEVG